MEYYDFKPSIIVNITDQYERKMKAVSCYKSQMYNPENKGLPTYISSDRFLREIESRFRYYGSKIHGDYAEGFKIDTPIEIEDVVHEIAMRSIIPGQSNNMM
jgi:hypothetical protein